VEPGRALDAAVQLELLRRHPRQAASLVERIETGWPESPYAVLSRARLDLQFGRYRTTAAELEALLSEQENETALRLLARALGPLKQHQSAANAIERARRLEPGFDPGLERLAVRVFHAAARPNAVLATLARLEAHGHTFQLDEMLIHAQSQYMVGNPGLGDRILAGLVAAETPLPEAVVEFAARNRATRPDRVAEILARSRAHWPANLSLVAEHMKLALSLGRNDDVLALAASVVESGRGLSRELALLRTRATIALGHTEEAEVDLMRMLKLWPNSRDVLDVLADLYEQDGRLSELVATFEAAADVGALRDAGPLIAGRLNLRTRNYEAALELLEPLLVAEPEPESDDLEIDAAEVPDVKVPDADAPGADVEAADTRVEWPAVRADVARALAESGRDLPRAIELGREALQLGRDVDAHLALGVAQLRSERWLAAETMLVRAVALSRSLDRPSAAAHLHLGEVLRQTGREAEAREAFERALAIDANDPRASQALESLDAGTGGGGGT
jgi:tetratricopeptide (TPR) repeat protein